MDELKWLLLSVPLLPWLLVLVKADGLGRWLLPLAAVPALLAAGFASGVTQDLPWVLLGLRWGLTDFVAQVWLGVSAWLWLCAGLYSVASVPPGSRHAWRFRVFFLLAMGGNFLLIVAQDMSSFFLGFAAMGLASYGLVVQQRSVTTTRAGRVYMVWTVLGEVALFAGMMLAMGVTGSHYFSQAAGVALPLEAVVLLTLGFGIKLALPGLHVWLPLAHGAAPPAVSALLSGVMVKAGILGLLRFLPTGAETTVWVAEILIGLGLFGAFYAVLLGLLQQAPKVILAYSTMSQLGLMSAFTGLVLLQTEVNAALVLALLWYMVHHALVKGALFLGVGVFKRNLAGWALGLLAVLALVLAGLPFTSGALAKAEIKAVLPADYEWLGAVLLVSTVATSLLMGRFVLSLQRYREQHRAHGHHEAAAVELLAWGLLLEGVFGWYWWVDMPRGEWVDFLPIILGVLLSVPLWWVARLPRVAAGDVPVWLAKLGYRARQRVQMTRCRVE
ncbi:MAG: complex I subunit 5 family protein [Thiothrix litoralis]